MLKIQKKAFPWREKACPSDAEEICFLHVTPLFNLSGFN
jgi:hypothetical protein